MGYNEKELKAKLEQEKENIVIPSKKETIGDILKNKRLETGKTIEEISDYLRIKAGYLSALEENNFNKLPGSAYVIGFIKSYASYLALDVNAIIVQYKQETGGFSQSSALSTEDENILIKDPAINSNHIIIAGIIVLLGIIFVSFTSSKDATDVIEKTEQPAEDVEISIQSDNISSNESVDADVQTIVFPAKETTKEEMKISTPEYFETNMSTITSVEPEKKEEVKAEEKVVEEVVVPETHVAREYGLENKDDSNIYIKATKKVWIKLKKDGLYKYDNEQGDIGSGVTVFETILDDGDTYYVPQGDNYYLTIGNAQGIDIYANGEKIAPLSKKEVSRHNIEMNVEKLKNGTAYVRNRVIE